MVCLTHKISDRLDDRETGSSSGVVLHLPDEVIRHQMNDMVNFTFDHLAVSKDRLTADVLALLEFAFIEKLTGSHACRANYLLPTMGKYCGFIGIESLLLRPDTA